MWDGEGGVVQFFFFSFLGSFRIGVRHEAGTYKLVNSGMVP